MDLSDLPSALIIASFALMMLALAQLARIQKEAIAHLRDISAEEASRIYSRDYTDGDGATFKWGELRTYCDAVGESSRLWMWVWVAIGAVAGGVGAIFLDQAMR